jgi:hypothetical protein
MTETKPPRAGAAPPDAALLPDAQLPPDPAPSDVPTDAAGEAPIGRVGTPPNLEATADQFAFWVPEGTPIEQTQIVRAQAFFPSVGQVTYFGLVEEVSRRSRRHDILEERDRYDGVPSAELLLESGGVTYARARVITTDPPILTPPREESPVVIARGADARKAYGVDEMVEPMPFGVLKNGARLDAGPAWLDLADVLGQNSAHVNVTGISGAGTKSSALTTLVACMLAHARSRPAGDSDPLRIVPVILNVKGTDLLFLDQPSKTFAARRDDENPVWERIGFDPRPFANATFYAPQQVTGNAAMARGRATTPYSWGLADLVEADLFEYLFSDEDREDANFGGLVTAIVQLLTREFIRDERVERSLSADAPARTMDQLVTWIAEQIETDTDGRRIKHFQHGTWSKLYRRLLRVVHSGSGVVRRYEERGSPLDVRATETVPPRVVDLQAVGDGGMQRFVVGALLRQIADARTGTSAIAGLRYLVVIDELNRWAPRGGRDPITRLVEHLASEMRSQGVVLLGAQQQASQVSEKVIENAAVKLLGRTGAMELDHTLWRGLPPAFRRMIGNLRPSEKVVITPSARQPMVVRMPFPPWAMRGEDVEPQVSGRAPETWTVE